MARPTILFVTGEYPPLRGGVADYTARLREALEEAGHETHVLSGKGAEGENVSTVEHWSWPVAIHVSEIIERHPIDIVHIQYQAGAFDMHVAINALPTALTSWRRMPVVTTYHDLRVPYLFPKAGRLRQAVMLRMARASSRAIVTNPGDQQILARAEIEPVRIPLGPSLPEPTAVHRDRGEPAVGFFGFPSREKGIIELIQAIGHFPATERPKLVLVGATRPDTGTHEYLLDVELDELADQMGVCIERTGYLPPQEAANRLASTDVVALPFTHGASQRSSALIAALRLGVPVVTTGNDLHDELDGLAELPQLFAAQPGDIDALYHALLAAIQSEVIPTDLPDSYAWRTVAARHSELYETLVTQQGR